MKRGEGGGRQTEYALGCRIGVMWEETSLLYLVSTTNRKKTSAATQTCLCVR